MSVIIDRPMPMKIVAVVARERKPEDNKITTIARIRVIISIFSKNMYD